MRNEPADRSHVAYELDVGHNPSYGFPIEKNTAVVKLPFLLCFYLKL